MYYLIPSDFNVLIQPANLAQVLGGNTSIQGEAMLAAQETAKEYLQEKFLIDDELCSTNILDLTKTYFPGDRIYLDAASYDSTKTYILGTLTLNGGLIYKCTTAIVAPEVFNIANWTLLGNQYAVYIIPIQTGYEKFDVYSFYKTQARVIWKQNYYICQIASLRQDHSTVLQLQYTECIPLPNVFPDDPDNGIMYWGNPVTAGVAAAAFPTGFLQNDTRNKSLVRHLVAIALYVLHFRISPANVPNHIHKMYQGSDGEGVATSNGYIYPDYCALGWLQSASLGRKPINIPLIQPRSGGRIAWGSKIRNQNGY